MKHSLVITIAVLMLLGVGNTFAEVLINEVPLNHQDVTRLDGAELYGNLCSACHGASGKGDGPAASALEKPAPNLTLLSFNNEGAFPHKQVERLIRGKSRVIEHGSIGMPSWEQQFTALRSGWTGFPQKAYVRNRIHALATHIETLQMDQDAEALVAKAD